MGEIYADKSADSLNSVVSPPDRSAAAQTGTANEQGVELMNQIRCIHELTAPFCDCIALIQICTLVPSHTVVTILSIGGVVGTSLPYQTDSQHAVSLALSLRRNGSTGIEWLWAFVRGGGAEGETEGGGPPAS